MKKCTLIIGFLLVSASCFGQSKVKLDDNLKQEAERIWELAIEAKGGHEKLNSIQNVVFVSDSDNLGGFKKYRIHLVDLIVFPHKQWTWNDQRPSHFGLSMRMDDWETGKSYGVDFGNPLFHGFSDIQPMPSNEGYPGLIGIFLETKWDKISPERVGAGKLKGTRVDILDAMLGRFRVQFSLDKKTHLVLRYAIFQDDRLNSATRLTDYLDVDGIKMPAKVVYEASDGDMEYHRTYQFNVAYDPSIFVKPPPFEAGPQAWKAK